MKTLRFLDRLELTGLITPASVIVTMFTVPVGTNASVNDHRLTPEASFDEM